MPARPCTRSIPVTVVTGYLGAGKTTLVNHLLSCSKDRRLAVIVNEFSDIGIDGDLVESGGEELIELSSGCICCVVRGDLIRVLRRLLAERPGLDGIVIETTGLANPSPVIQTFYADQVLSGQLRLDAVVTVVDAINFERQLADNPDAADQVALASVILLNKSSEAHSPAILKNRLRELNPFAPVHAIDRGIVESSLLFDTNSFELERVQERLAEMTVSEETHDHHHSRDAGFDIETVSFRADLPFSASRLEAWLRELLAVEGERILRTKGIFWIEDQERKLVLQSVNMLMEGDYTSAWNAPPPRESRLVFIGRGLDRPALKSGFEMCQASS